MIGVLSYNSSNNRYGLLAMDLWQIEGFRAGQCLDLWDDLSKQWIPTKMLMHYQAPSFPQKRPDWYLSGTDYRGKSLEGLKVRATIEGCDCDG